MEPRLDSLSGSQLHFDDVVNFALMELSSPQCFAVFVVYDVHKLRGDRREGGLVLN